MTTASPRLYGRRNAAREAADRLAAQGHHVHYAAHGATQCITGHCATDTTKDPRR